MKDLLFKGIILSIILLLALLVSLFILKSDQKMLLCIIVAILSIAFCIFSMLTTAHGLEIANANIFKGSGEPKSMAFYLYQSFFLQSKTLITILIISIISILLIIEILKPSEGLPVVTGAAGFLLGKDFSFSKETDKEEPIATSKQE